MKKYINYLKMNKYSINTVKTYSSILKIHKEHMKDIRILKKEISKRFNKPNTAWLHFNVICSYMKWKNDKRIKSFKTLKLPPITLEYMPVFTKRFILKKTKILKSDCERIKNMKKTILFMFETGIRASELNKITTFKKSSIVILGKGNKSREVFYMSEVPYYVKNHSISTKTLRIWVKHILGKEFTPHSIRRSLATHLLLNGADPKMVMLQLGHSKIETTFRYLHLSYEVNKKIYNKCY